VVEPLLPAVKQRDWPRDDLDFFILERLEASGLQPSPDADRYTLLRRIALDLTGLPPSESEIRSFVADPAPLDRLLPRIADHYLASAEFGERWGRHWLDVVRYADSVGRTWNAPFTYAWRYRDYVIDAFNRDKPYDRFILEQLAGDLLPAESTAERRELLIATGLLTLGSMSLTDGRLEGFAMDRVDDQIDVTTRAFLGLTVACARCHDHKYDPITMRDYYALAGIFCSSRTFSGQGHLGNLGRGGYVDDELLLRLPSVADGGPAVISGGIHSMNEFMNAHRAGQRDVRYTTHPDLAMGMAEGEVRDCELRIQGDAYDRGPLVPRGVLSVPGLPSLAAIPPDASGRLELAQWIASPEHPLTARVMANRVWRHLFGRGLAPTMDDFGVTGELPSHPELLDFLARRLVEEQWSLKRLIRSLVLSRAYRQSSAGRSEAWTVDPTNQRYWRMNPRRLEVEVIRDGLLDAAGRLGPSRPEGIQVAGTGGKGKQGVVRSLLPIDAPYRTVYLPVIRSLVPELHDTFDFPDPCQIQGERQVTTVAPQALFFLNSDLVRDSAQGAARRLLADVVNDGERVQAAYVRLLGRPATPDESRDAMELLGGLQPESGAGDPRLYRWTVLIQALMASAAFRYVL
jgi:hypothetical protein